MATEVPEASGPPAIPELEPEAVQPVTETLRDESAVSSLEDEKIRLIAMLSAFDGAGIEGLPGQFEKVKEAMLQAGIPSSHIDTVRKAMEKKDYKESVYQISRAFNVAELAKKKKSLRMSPESTRAGWCSTSRMCRRLCRNRRNRRRNSRT